MRQIQRAIIHVSATDRWRNALTFLHVKISNQLYFRKSIFMEQYQGVSPSIGHRDMYYSLLDLSRQGASNDSRFMSLASLDKKLFVFYCFSFF